MHLSIGSSSKVPDDTFRMAAVAFIVDRASLYYLKMV
jgi:hypothetical protein